MCGHEAMHLAKCLNEELANQKAEAGRRSNRAVSPDPEPRSRSYDHKSPAKGKGKITLLSRLFDLNLFLHHPPDISLLVLLRFTQ